MEYRQEISQRVVGSEIYRRRSVPVERVEAFYEEQATKRLNGVMRVAETAVDGLVALHGAAEQKCRNTPSAEYDVRRIVASVALVCEQRLLWYGLSQ